MDKTTLVAKDKNLEFHGVQILSTTPEAQRVPGTGLSVATVQKMVPHLQSLLAQLECIHGIPESVLQSAGRIHALLAGPGPSALDMRPQSAEVINDAALHARALAEAKAREMGDGRSVVNSETVGQLMTDEMAQAIEGAYREPMEIDAEMTLLAETRSEILAAAERYDAAKIAHLEEIEQSYELGKKDAVRLLETKPLSTIVWERFIGFLRRMWTPRFR